MTHLLALFLVLCSVTAAPAQTFSGAVRVIDGDTLDVGTVRVRLYGIDAPEIGQPCSRGEITWDCGRWARGELARRYQGRTADCRQVTRDTYGRVVARCNVAGVDLGALLVAEGLAEAYRRYALDYIDEEKAASIVGRGIWQGMMQAPADYRAAVAGGVAVAASHCAIKGNVTQRGKIYHLPGQEHYADTRISARHGERWFCTEADALAAGWRKARR